MVRAYITRVYTGILIIKLQERKFVVPVRSNDLPDEALWEPYARRETGTI